MEHALFWWEKTVEYKFILDAERDRKLSFAAPLSGAQERGAADAIFSHDSNIVLVEFKRSKTELSSEELKFNDYAAAVDALSDRDAHHFFVYGSSTNGGKDLSLHACRYFNRTQTENVLDILSNGISNQEFQTYLADLLKFKKSDGRSSGTIGPESVAAAIGISRSGSCAAVSLSEYCRIAVPHLYEAYEFTPQYSSPSPGG